MALETYLPRSPLAHYVHMLWYWEGYHPPHPRERILPGGMMEITINLSQVPFRIYNMPAPDAPQVIDGPMAAGARSTCFVIETAQPMSILSVWFKPGGAFPLFGVSGHELHNRHLPLDILWGIQAHDLYDKLMHARTTQDRFHTLEAELLRRLRISGERHPAVDYALQRFGTVPHAETVSQVVEAIGLSTTRFIQVFREDVGMTPKQFCRVQRFQHALRLIANSRIIKWADVALRCGYYDQSHFINDFRALAGITPATYKPQNREHNTNLPDHGIV